ncbi:MAG: hypothetical protein GY799_13490 [Desulfobulbaceae bacterium]|nr:hypothetical protein [Desulfobulbaceae bacterium]
MKHVASLQYGVVFKKAFCDPEIFVAFARDMLGMTLEIDHVETEKAFDPPIGYVKPRFDLFAQDTKHRVIVDIQHARTSDHYDRFLYYHCAALLEQIASSKDYHPTLKVFTLVVLTSGDRHKTDIAITDFDPHDLTGHPLQEIPHKVVYLCPKYVADTTPEPYREWLQAINDTLDGEVDETQYHRAAIQKLFDQIQQHQISPEERARMIDESHQEELQQAQFEEGKIFVANALLKKGIALEIIAETTGLSQDALTQLQG